MANRTSKMKIVLVSKHSYMVAWFEFEKVRHTQSIAFTLCQSNQSFPREMFNTEQRYIDKCVVFFFSFFCGLFNSEWCRVCVCVQCMLLLHCKIVCIFVLAFRFGYTLRRFYPIFSISATFNMLRSCHYCCFSSLHFVVMSLSNSKCSRHFSIIFRMRPSRLIHSPLFFFIFIWLVVAVWLWVCVPFGLCSTSL